jgi:hypothetical protein
VPDYLDEVPLDIYSGVEVQFNKEKSIFYVVGPDLKDDLGVKGFDKQTTPKYEGDIVQYIFPLENEDEENVSSIQE